MRHELDQAIGMAPVSTIDVDTVVTKGRRRTFRRRLAVAGGAGGTALAAVGVVVAMSLTTATPPAVGQQNQTKLQPAAPTGAAPAHAGETTEQTRQRLASALTAGLTTALPGVQITDGPTGQPGVDIYYAPNVRFDTDTVIRTSAGASEIFLISWPGGQMPESARGPVNVISWLDSCADLPTYLEMTMGDGHKGAGDCQESTGPQGQTIVAVTQRCDDCAQPLVYRHDVYVTWTNAKVNLAVSGDLKRGNPEAKPTTLLTVQQLIAIASDPNLTA